jgi:hypothetical protein
MMIEEDDGLKSIRHMYMTLTAKLSHQENVITFKSVDVSQMKVFRPNPAEELSMEAGLFMSLASI